MQCINISRIKILSNRHWNLQWNRHDDVIKWKHFSRYWPFVRGIHRSLVNSPHKGQWRGALMVSLILARINSWVNNGEARNLRRHRAHYNVIVMILWITSVWTCIIQNINQEFCTRFVLSYLNQIQRTREYIQRNMQWYWKPRVTIVAHYIKGKLLCHEWRQGWQRWPLIAMMTSSNGNIFRETGPLCGEFTGGRWIPRTKASDAELWCFLSSAPV